MFEKVYKGSKNGMTGGWGWWRVKWATCKSFHMMFIIVIWKINHQTAEGIYLFLSEHEKYWARLFTECDRHEYGPVLNQINASAL